MFIPCTLIFNMYHFIESDAVALYLHIISIFVHIAIIDYFLNTILEKVFEKPDRIIYLSTFNYTIKS